MKLVKGGSIGDIYGKAFIRDEEGHILYGTEGDYKGLPLVEGDGNTVKVGNANPVFMLGWDHSFSYKGFSLYFLLDWRYGGEIPSGAARISIPYPVRQNVSFPVSSPQKERHHLPAFLRRPSHTIRDK